MSDPNDPTLSQAKAIGDYLMPRVELVVGQRLESIDARLKTLEDRDASRSRGYHAITAVVSFFGALFTNSAWDFMRGKQ